MNPEIDNNPSEQDQEKAVSNSSMKINSIELESEVVESVIKEQEEENFEEENSKSKDISQVMSGQKTENRSLNTRSSLDASKFKNLRTNKDSNVKSQEYNMNVFYDSPYESNVKSRN